MGCIDKTKFTLNHSKPDLFHRSQWDRAGHASLWYVIYRVTVALFMAIGILVHAFSTKDTLGWKWLAYMTNQGISFLTIHYIYYAVIVVKRRISSGKEDELELEPNLPTSHKISWGLQTCFTTIALGISLVYWTLLHPIVVEYGLMKTTAQVVLNFFLHGVNSLSCIIDMFITARPFRIYHFWLPMLFGIWYTLFSVIYWAAGGVGMCIPRCHLIEGANPVTTADPCPVVCDHYIYPILDWEDNPGMAVGTTFGGCLIIPVLQCVWYGVYRLRKRIHFSTIGTIELDVVHPQKTTFI